MVHVTWRVEGNPPYQTDRGRLIMNLISSLNHIGAQNRRRHAVRMIAWVAVVAICFAIKPVLAHPRELTQHDLSCFKCILNSIRLCLLNVSIGFAFRHLVQWQAPERKQWAVIVHVVFWLCMIAALAIPVAHAYVFFIRR